MSEYHCTLAKKYDREKHDVIGWWMSEKLDGVRAIWCPKRYGFFSRSNKPLHVPPNWLDCFSTCLVKLDGEFFIGAGRFQDTVSAVRKKNPTVEDFHEVRYSVFDCFTDGPHEKRLEHAKKWMHDARAHASVLDHYRVRSIEDAERMYRDVLRDGGEGIMFRNPQSGYEMKRTGNLLKWKPDLDGIAVVTGFEAGKGKHEGRMGALICVDADLGVVFKIGTGFSDEEREWWKHQFVLMPDGGGVRIRWRAMGRTRDDIPRQPVYFGLDKGD